MIPKHTVAVTLAPNITCVLECKPIHGISAVLKITGRRSVTLQPHTWKALMDKKDLLGAITSCLTVYEDPVWLSKQTPPHSGEAVTIPPTASTAVTNTSLEAGGSV